MSINNCFQCDLKTNKNPTTYLNVSHRFRGWWRSSAGARARHMIVGGGTSWTLLSNSTSGLHTYCIWLHSNSQTTLETTVTTSIAMVWKLKVCMVYYTSEIEVWSTMRCYGDTTVYSLGLMSQFFSYRQMYCCCCLTERQKKHLQPWHAATP